MFASRYLEKNNTLSLIEKPPHPDTGIIIVIPCLSEPDVTQTLDSVKQCEAPLCRAEIIILINHSRNAPEKVKSMNELCKSNIQSWILRNSGERFDFFVVGPVELPQKWAGAGLARKKGMDEALRRFNLIQKPEGIIVSLDADTLVERNYLREIENHFRENAQDVGATISFKHQTDGLSDRHLQGILLYEKYMKYFRDALAFTGYPYPMFTVGSAFAVKSDAYVRRGGMNRRKAGEEFYFLQHLVEFGKVGEINTTAVHPSARLSDRVPFGTGPVLRKWMSGEKDLTMSYNIKAFIDLKQFFDVKDQLFNISPEDYRFFPDQLPEAVGSFLKKDNFLMQINDLNSNCSSLSTFRTRFFQKFNAFKILKFLNFAHEYFYEEADLKEQINNLYKRG
jgi:glycosyltransferase involved in cell wall biosynthesis